MAEAEKHLENMSVYSIKDVRSETEMTKVLKPVIAAKKYGYEEILTTLVAKACIHSCPTNAKKFDSDNIRTCKILGGGLEDSVVLPGMVIMRKVEGHVLRKDEPKVAVFSCPLEAATGETKANVVIKSAEELKSFSKGEEELLDGAVKNLHESGVDCVIVNGSVSDMALHFLDN